MANDKKLTILYFAITIPVAIGMLAAIATLKPMYERAVQEKTNQEIRDAQADEDAKEARKAKIWAEALRKAKE